MRDLRIEVVCKTKTVTFCKVPLLRGALEAVVVFYYNRHVLVIHHSNFSVFEDFFQKYHTAIFVCRSARVSCRCRAAECLPFSKMNEKVIKYQIRNTLCLNCLRMSPVFDSISSVRICVRLDVREGCKTNLKT